MRPRYLKYAAAAALSMAMSACGVTKHLPEGSYMLTKNKIVTDKEAPKEERIKASELSRHIPQIPSKKLFGTNFPAWLYLQADPGKDNGWNKFLRKAGSRPVLLDTALTRRGSENLKLYMDSRGFYESESDYAIRYNELRRKARVTYSVRQGRPFHIDSLSYDFHDDFIGQVILEDSASTLLNKGDIFDTNILREERKRITDYLHNRGYYNFSQQNIGFVADTTVGDHLVDLTMVVRQHLAGYDGEGRPILENNSVYRIKEIIVYSGYDPALAAADTLHSARLDTTDYNGLRIVSHGKTKILPHTLRRAIKLYPDYIYSYEDEQRTYDELLHLNYYKNARISFEVADETEENLVTYIGSEGEATHTTEKSLICRIYCTPTLKQAFTVNLEATYTSIYWGVKPSISYMNRNLFRGAELFNISLSGGYEINHGAMRGSRAFEIGSTASIYFPRFLAPFKVDQANRLFSPQTRLEFSITKQDRSLYDRVIFGGNIAYAWSNGRRSSYQFRPLDINVVKVNRVDGNFLLGIRNRYLWSSYQSQLVPAISGTYIYSNASRSGAGNSLTFRLNIEAAGNLTYLLSRMFSEKRVQVIDTGDPAETVTWSAYEVFKIPFSQYFRTEASISRLISFSPRVALAYRFLAGIGIAYGNAQSMPYDRQFFVGGSNSMRGWPVRGLGPGDNSTSIDRFDRVGNMRLEANVEMRFPIWGDLRGAVFFDTGNTWNALIKGGTEADGIFRFDTFFNQLGLNTGVGIRYDLGIAVIRLDWGIRLHDPSNPLGERWLGRFRFSNTALNFGIGYPF